jgi:hypothetical protein
MAKKFRMKERLWLRFKGTFTNTFNSPHLGPPTTNVVVVRHRAKHGNRGTTRGGSLRLNF